MLIHLFLSAFFFFTDTATTEIYTLSLHDALPISSCSLPASASALTSRNTPTWPSAPKPCPCSDTAARSSCRDRKSTGLNSSHLGISYAVFCLKKKKIKKITTIQNNNTRQIQHLVR